MFDFDGLERGLGPNTNYLKGMQCPVFGCQSYGPFYIDVFAVALVSDYGTDLNIDQGDPDWDEDSRCYCTECKHEATVADFIIKPTPLEQLARAREADDE